MDEKLNAKLDMESSVIRLLHRGAIVPDEDEVLANPRARSAKLRAAEKLVRRAA